MIMAGASPPAPCMERLAGEYNDTLGTNGAPQVMPPMLSSQSSWRSHLEALAEHRYGRWGLVIIAFADSSFLPLPPDLLLVPMALVRPRRVWWLCFLCTVASSLGAILGYVIGASFWNTIGVDLVAYYGCESSFAVYQDLLIRWGVYAIILKALTPLPFKIIAIAAGVGGMNPWVFLVSSFVGRALHFAMIGGTIALWGDRTLAVIGRYHRFATVIGLMFVGIALAYAATG
jgi:membrane protein YqaA with SNARE-associated domain